MKNRKWMLTAMSVVTAFTLCACGEQMYELSEEEANTIADYAAHVISKHNTNQEKGVVKLADETETVQEETTETEPQETETEENTGEGGGENTSDSQEETMVSLQEAVNPQGLTITYKDYEVRDDYIEGDYYAIDAPEGSKILVLRFDLTNAGSEAVSCDMLARNMSFQIEVNGDTKKSSDVTILLDDLASYQGTIGAETTQSTVLLFTLPSEKLESVDRLILTVTEEGADSRVQLK